MNNYHSPKEIIEVIIKKGETKVALPLLSSIILGILAGVYIAFGAQMATLAATGTAETLGYGLSKMLIGASFSIGLMLVVIAGAELFTGNNLIIQAVLKKKATWFQFWKNLGIIYIANFIGALLIVFLIYYSGLWQSADNQLGMTAVKIANGKVNLEFAEALTRGILCNWLVCLAIMLAVSARDVIGKIFACFFPIMAFVAMGFEHSIANMFFIPMGIILKKQPEIIAISHLEVTNLTWSNFFFANLVPVTIGNIIGGAIFVGLLYGIVHIKKN